MDILGNVLEIIEVRGLATQSKVAGLAAGMDMLVGVSFAIYPTFVASQATAIFFSVAFAKAKAEADTITDF